MLRNRFLFHHANCSGVFGKLLPVAVPRVAGGGCRGEGGTWCSNRDELLIRNCPYIVSAGFEGIIKLFSLLILEQ